MRNASNISRRRKSALSEGSSDYMAKRAELVEIAGMRFKANGFQGTNLAEIGRQAGLDRATVYYYFGSKEELFRECLKVGVDANLTECERIVNDKSLAARDKLKGIIVQLMKAYDMHYPHMYVYIQEVMSQVANEKSIWATQIMSQTRKFERIVMNLISELRDKGVLRRDIPVSIAANAIFGMLNWTHRWYQPGGAHSASEISDAFCKIFFEGALERKRSS